MIHVLFHAMFQVFTQITLAVFHMCLRKMEGMGINKLIQKNALVWGEKMHSDFYWFHHGIYGAHALFNSNGFHIGGL